jgi:hypothetical protein
MSTFFIDELGHSHLLSANEESPGARRSRRRWPACLALLLMALVVTGIGGAMVTSGIHQARRARCAEQLKRLGLAMHEFQEAHGHFPAGAITDREGRPLLSWRVALLPQLGYQSLYDEFHLDEPWDSPHNLALMRRMPEIYACPSLDGDRSSSTTYQVVVGPKPELGSVGTLFEWNRGVEIREVLDGTSNTVMIFESSRPIVWTAPDDPNFDREAPLPAFGSEHPDGYHLVLADGAVRFVKRTFPEQSLRNLLTRDGSEVISAA